MKVEKLVRITAKSECMDIEVVMISRKAASYLKKLSRIQNGCGNRKISIRIEPAGEILN
jgi:hypothetical protein